MGTKLLKSTMAIFVNAFCFTTIVVACDDQPGDNLLQRFIVLTATVDAPAGAKGFASVDFGCFGTNSPTLRVGTEGLLVGFLALRTGKRIEWDAKNVKAIGCPEADRFIHPEFRKGWTI